MLLSVIDINSPNYNNLKTNSVRFASIIRESCNLYEILSKQVYYEIFEIDEGSNLNIFNYLSLDAILELSNSFISSPYILSMIDYKQFLQPFKELMSWDRNSRLADSHKPIWWISYNKIKHEKNGLDVATLENAILAIGAVYILINRIYGEGVLIGPLREPISFNKLSLEYIEYKTEESKLFTQATARVDSIFKY